MAARRGTTLIEVLVTTGLVFLVVGLAALLLVRTTRATLRGTMRVEMQQQGVLALEKVLAAMRLSCSGGVSVRSGAQPRAVAVCPVSSPTLRSGEPSPLQADGRLRWSSFFQIFYHHEASRQLRFREWPPGSVPASALETSRALPRRLSPARLAEVLSGSASREAVLVSGVTEFNLTYPPGGSDDQYIQPLTLQIVQQREGNTGHGRPEVFTCTRTVFLAEQR